MTLYAVYLNVWRCVYATARVREQQLRGSSSKRAGHPRVLGSMTNVHDENWRCICDQAVGIETEEETKTWWDSRNKHVDKKKGIRIFVWKAHKPADEDLMLFNRMLTTLFMNLSAAGPQLCVGATHSVRYDDMLPMARAIEEIGQEVHVNCQYYAPMGYLRSSMPFWPSYEYPCFQTPTHASSLDLSGCILHD